MNIQDPAQSADLSPVDERVQPGGPLPGAVKRGGEVQIYFVRAVRVGLIKIGKADCAVKRFGSLKTMSPDQLELLGIMLCDRRGALERQLHSRFRQLRAHGEWFHPSPTLLQFIADNVMPPRPPRRLSILEARLRNAKRRARRLATERVDGEAEWDEAFGFNQEPSQ